jgi:hypothetical protein
MAVFYGFRATIREERVPTGCAGTGAELDGMETESLLGRRPPFPTKRATTSGPLPGPPDTMARLLK